MDNQIFIKDEEHKEILDTVDLLKKKLIEAKEILTKIDEVREEEENELDTWKSNLTQVESKLHLLDKNLFNTDF